MTVPGGGLLLDPTVLAGLGLSVGAGGEPASLGPQALPGAIGRSSPRKVSDRERRHRGVPEGGSWVHWAQVTDLDLQRKHLC